MLRCCRRLLAIEGLHLDRAHSQSQWRLRLDTRPEYESSAFDGGDVAAASAPAGVPNGPFREVALELLHGEGGSGGGTGGIQPGKTPPPRGFHSKNRNVPAISSTEAPRMSNSSRLRQKLVTGTNLGWGIGEAGSVRLLKVLRTSAKVTRIMKNPFVFAEAFPPVLLFQPIVAWNPSRNNPEQSPRSKLALFVLRAPPNQRTCLTTPVLNS
jgi:hypothetical protein